jgi:hypothetical protein
MARKWTVHIENNKYQVEAVYGEFFSYGGGKVFVNGRLADEWGPGDWGMLPKEKTFEIAGKKATLKRKGIFLLNMDLIVPEATEVTRVM